MFAEVMVARSITGFNEGEVAYATEKLGIGRFFNIVILN